MGRCSLWKWKQKGKKECAFFFSFGRNPPSLENSLSFFFQTTSLLASLLELSPLFSFIFFFTFFCSPFSFFFFFFFSFLLLSSFLTKKKASEDAPTTIVGDLEGLPEGKHAIALHVFGNLSQGYPSLGPHFNPFGKTHGAPEDETRHVGSLGNVTVGKRGLLCRIFSILLESIVIIFTNV